MYFPIAAVYSFLPHTLLTLFFPTTSVGQAFLALQKLGFNGFSSMLITCALVCAMLLLKHSHFPVNSSHGPADFGLTCPWTAPGHLCPVSCFFSSHSPSAQNHPGYPTSMFLEQIFSPPAFAYTVLLMECSFSSAN